MELHQIIYGLLAAQIEFGTYRYKDPLPKLEDASRWFSVSLDTVRAAYLQLKREGYITTAKKAGSVVAVQFQEEELERHIQVFFSLRRDAVMDLCQSLGPLFGHIQWFALKHAEPERLDELERLSKQPQALMPYGMVQHIRLIYSPLNNDLLLRLLWQVFLFYQAPFLSLPENLAAFKGGDAPLLEMIGLCRCKDWDGLWRAVAAYQDQLTCAISWFYTSHITLDPPGEPIAFHWSAYQNTSQRCYSLALELLQGICRGRFAQEGFLPSPAILAEKNQLSIITVRRTLTLLNQLGATRSVNGVGTQVLNTGDRMAHCDFSQPVIQKRLLDFIQSLQILALTCRACVESAFAAMDGDAVGSWKERLAALKESQQYEFAAFDSLEIVSRFSPMRSVREIYSQLLQLLMCGYPLRRCRGSREETSRVYAPYVYFLEGSLARCDGAGLAAGLEHLLLYELQFAMACLEELGIKEAAGLVIPERLAL